MERTLRQEGMSGANGGGIQAWSTEVPYEPLIVFAVGDILRSAQFNAWALDRGLRFKRMIGTWRGTTEHSFIARWNDRHLFLSWLAGQESVLRLSSAFRHGMLFPHRRAALHVVYPNGIISGVGQYVGLYALAGEARPDGDFTYDPEAKLYWHIEPGTGEDPAADEVAYALTYPKPTLAALKRAPGPTPGPRGYHDVNNGAIVAEQPGNLDTGAHSPWPVDTARLSERGEFYGKAG